MNIAEGYEGMTMTGAALEDNVWEFDFDTKKRNEVGQFEEQHLHLTFKDDEKVERWSFTDENDN